MIRDSAGRDGVPVPVPIARAGIDRKHPVFQSVRSTRMAGRRSLPLGTWRGSPAVIRDRAVFQPPRPGGGG